VAEGQKKKEAMGNGMGISLPTGGGVWHSALSRTFW